MTETPLDLSNTWEHSYSPFADTDGHLMPWEDLGSGLLYNFLPKLQHAPRTQRHVQNIIEQRRAFIRYLRSLG